MFPHDYFPAGAFAPDYFPPVVGGVVPPVPPVGGGGHIVGPVPVHTPERPVDEFGDDEFLTWFT